MIPIHKLQNQRIQDAVSILRTVSNDWFESDLKFYPATLESFDEVIEEIAKIEFKQQSGSDNTAPMKALLEQVRAHLEIQIKASGGVFHPSEALYLEICEFLGSVTNTGRV